MRCVLVGEEWRVESEVEGWTKANEEGNKKKEEAEANVRFLSRSFCFVHFVLPSSYHTSFVFLVSYFTNKGTLGRGWTIQSTVSKWWTHACGINCSTVLFAFLPPIVLIA